MRNGPRGSTGDLIRAVALRRGRLRRAEHASRRRLLEVQEARLAALLEHAWTHSPFYRRRRGRRCPGPGDLRDIEPLSKAELLEHYDEVLADRSLSARSLRQSLAADAPGRHRVVATSGTTGEPLPVPYARTEWAEGLALALRGETRRSAGILRGLRQARRMATVMTQNRHHASTQIHASIRVPFLRRLHLAAGTPVESQIAALQAFRPTTLAAYPSAVDLLARAQVDARLAIAPERVLIGGETPAAGLRERVRAAWGAEVFDCYGLTETLVIGWECREHAGLHIDEDAVILEVVDAGDRPVDPGETGQAVLVTNLYNATLPLVRYRVDDRMAVTGTPCRCGVPFARIVSLEGRTDEMLRLKGQRGPEVVVHPAAVEGALERISSIRRFRMQEEGGVLHVLIEGPAAGGPPERAAERALRDVLEPLGVSPEALRVRTEERIEHEHGPTGKRRRIARG